ncbi:MAG: helix-turn-helix transcriptional regulator [Pirellulales bacterium]|nr:helix-turn-helix transcriptional regulator [Pirellulales bacterium]
MLLKIAESCAPSQKGLTRAYSTYQRCRQYIEDNCHRLRSLEQIARECRIDHSYLCRLFHRHEHQTPYRLLMRLKMNLAAERLQTSNILVKQVATELGFDDPFHFSRSFKNVFGLSPESFRHLR